MSQPILPGTLLDERYQVERLLGAGSFARVYLARHITLHSAHAVKVLNDEFTVQPDARERFLSEGRIQAQLRHPHLVAVTDILGDPPSLVLEFIEGPSLDEWLAELGRPLHPDEVMAVMVPVLDAIGAVHGAGIVHRDIKPENIIVSRDSRGRLRPMVSDFGIAKLLEESVLLAKKQRTESGLRLGTPAYMSPEQVRGDADLGKASDIFALGVLLYELVTGHHPFSAEGDFETMQNIVEGRCRPFPASTPEGVVRCVQRAMAVAVASRFADCDEFRVALDLAFGDEPTQSGSGAFRIPEAVKAPVVAAPAPPPARRPAAPRVAEPGPSGKPTGRSTLFWVLLLFALGVAALLACAGWLLGFLGGLVTEWASPTASQPAAPRAGLAGLPEFVAVPSARFTMGAPVGEPGRFKDEVQHPVVLTRAYAIATTEVTTALWRQYQPDPALAGRRADLPMEGVSWLDAVAFCNALSAASGRAPAYVIGGAEVQWMPDAPGFRLPTEAEWEFAARAQQPGPFAGGAAVATVAWFAGSSGGEPHPPSQLAHNRLGLYDMSGNVGEWVWDRQGDYPTGEETDPEGAQGGETRVIRGGSYKDVESAVRVAYRKAALPGARGLPVGLRLVVSGPVP